MQIGNFKTTQLLVELKILFRKRNKMRGEGKRGEHTLKSAGTLQLTLPHDDDARKGHARR